MKFTALLPMKGESERVPNKNIRDFNGKPLFLHVLQTLHDVEQIDKVIINTDSEIIMEMARSYEKVIFHKRPDSLLGHFVPMNDIIAYDVDKSGDEYFIQTHSTNPLIKANTISNALSTYEKEKAKHDSFFSVTRLQTRLYWGDGTPINHNPQELLRTQDLAPVYEENSNFFIFSKSSFRNAKNKRIGLQSKMIEVNQLEALDIDELEDFLLAEAAQKIIR
jgi:CMP-N-acetylneuraminic acid synthetase